MHIYFFYLNDGYRSFVLLHEKVISKPELQILIESIPQLNQESSKKWLIDEHGFINAKETFIDLDENYIETADEKKEGEKFG